MKTPGKRTFEEQWRDAFENAELPPDASVWNQMETRLANAEADKYKRQLYTFKLRMAAAVALLVVAMAAGTGWYLASRQPATLAAVPPGAAKPTTPNTGTEKPGTEQPASPIRPETNADPVAARKPETPAALPEGTVPGSPEAISQEKPPVAVIESGNGAPTRKPQTALPENALAGANTPSGKMPAAKSAAGKFRAVEILTGKLPTEKPALARAGTENRKARFGNRVSRKGPSENSIPGNAQTPPILAANPASETTDGTIAAEKPAQNTRNGDAGSPDTDTQTGTGALPAMRQSFALLTPRPVRAGQYTLAVKDIRWQLTEAVWSQLAAEDEAARRKKSRKPGQSRWQMGLGFASSRFNPNFRTQDIPANYAGFTPASNSYNARTAVSPSAQDLSRIARPGLAYTTDVQVGFALSKRFSLQGGVQYRYDNSQLEVSQYLADVAGNRMQPAFYGVLNGNALNADAVAEKAPPAPLQANSLYVATYDNAQAQVVDNTYQYMGFPMRLVYKVLNGKVRASVGAGMSADVFLRNRIGGGANNVETIEITPSSNSAYRNLGFSGLLSLKVDCSLGGRYSVFVEPSYRKALTSFTASSSLESFPSWWGVGTGLQYRF